MRTSRLGVRLQSDSGRARGSRPLASVLAFGLAILGEAASIALVIGADFDPAGVRWWLLLLPVVVAALPVSLPTHGTRVGAAIVLALWTALASASLGLFFLPATLAALVAARPAKPGRVRLKSDTLDTARSRP